MMHKCCECDTGLHYINVSLKKVLFALVAQHCNDYKHTLTLRLAGAQQVSHAQVADG